MPAWAANRAIATLIASAALLLPLPSSAQTSDLVSQSRFRVCADPANVPFSSKDGAGFENRIAELMADKIGRPLEYTWFPQALGFVRRTLMENRCDVIIGFAQGHDLVLNSNHYYTSAYVLVTMPDSPMAGVDTLSDPKLQGKRIGIMAGSPPATHVARHGLIGNAKGYRLMVDRRVESPAEQAVADLKSGEIDAAVLWGPIGGYYAKQEGLSMVPLLKEEGAPRLFYRITMGVRAGELSWKRELNKLIRRNQKEIDAILTDFGVPLLDEQGKALKKACPMRWLGALIFSALLGSLAYANEPEPAGYRMDHYRAPVPQTLAGVIVVDDEAAHALWKKGETAFVDVMPRAPKPEGLPAGTIWREKPRRSIPGAIWLPNVGYGAIHDETHAYFKAGLDAATGGNPDHPVLFFCLADCWMSWNAAKRAREEYGHTQVYWYPDGTDGWEFEGWLTEKVKRFEMPE